MTWKLRLLCCSVLLGPSAGTAKAQDAAQSENASRPAPAPYYDQLVDFIYPPCPANSDPSAWVRLFDAMVTEHRGECRSMPVSTEGTDDIHARYEREPVEHHLSMRKMRELYWVLAGVESDAQDNAGRSGPPALEQQYIHITDSPHFGASINADAGLVGSIVINERNFDLIHTGRRSRLTQSVAVEGFWDGRAHRGSGQEFRLEVVPGTQVQRYSVAWIYKARNDRQGAMLPHQPDAVCAEMGLQRMANNPQGLSRPNEAVSAPCNDAAPEPCTDTNHILPPLACVNNANAANLCHVFTKGIYATADRMAWIEETNQWLLEGNVVIELDMSNHPAKILTHRALIDAEEGNYEIMAPNLEYSSRVIKPTAAVIPLTPAVRGWR
jgi:hypothetical protein